MNNHIEVAKTPEGEVYFDHSSGNMWAKWSNGYSETWHRRGYSIEQKLYSFYLMTNQFDKMNALPA